MKGLFAFAGGIGAAIGVAWLFDNRRNLRQFTEDAVKTASSAASSVSQLAHVDLNECSREDLVGLGLSDDLVDRVVENRPYRNKLDLISRFVIPEDVYETVKNSLGVDGRSANEPIKIAS